MKRIVINRWLRTKFDTENFRCKENELTERGCPLAVRLKSEFRKKIKRRKFSFFPLKSFSFSSLCGYNIYC